MSKGLHDRDGGLLVAHQVRHPNRGTRPGVTRSGAPRGDATQAQRGHDPGMAHNPRLDVLQAAVVALAAALRPEQAAYARAVLLAGVADLEDRPAGSAEDAVAAGALAAVLGALVRT